MAETASQRRWLQITTNCKSSQNMSHKPKKISKQNIYNLTVLHIIMYLLFNHKNIVIPPPNLRYL